ncbi:MAG: hypothetical protein A3B38_03840 [Candidatus Levybacteria bacterium RIFCSPLOWO2_01_FULL_36_13]|nr:MAG: hypothetical protein A2684_00775 [Candidatus Levybacteria bacterium RIFCSPHIGHO2_01_FULL_36_15b]OGH34263.1 MAG: hypothetical protein A3B38_03840 [Candidatus Levybacteria bacterium RIFCSPLOWO2_01_FULL_36_13]
MKKMHLLQSFFLLVGTLFAWFTVYGDFTRFYNIYHSLTRVQNCIIPNPITTPCFYGAFAFLGAFIWSLYILKTTAEKKIKHQKFLSIFLVGGTIFAWSNLSLEVYNFYAQKMGPKVSCSGVATDNIFTTACFIGSMIFLVSLITALIIHKRNRNKKNIT